MPTPKKISEFKPIITNLAQTSHYQVIFGAMSNNLLSYLAQSGVSGRFIAEDAGLLCASASLPGSSLATADISGNYMGVSEKMAHTRIFTEIGLEFYVDANYTMMKFLESWMEYIASGSDDDGVDPYSRNYYYRMRYPEEYKCDTTKIVKFDRNYGRELEYNFIGLFPINMSSIPISYDASDILKVSVTFNYERYIPGKITSKSKSGGTSNNVGSDSQSSSATTTSQSSNLLGPPTAIGLNSQQTLNEFYQYGLNGGKSAADFIGPVP